LKILRQDFPSQNDFLDGKSWFRISIQNAIYLLFIIIYYLLMTILKYLKYLKYVCFSWTVLRQDFHPKITFWMEHPVSGFSIQNV